jgi:hypothetical protein
MSEPPVVEGVAVVRGDRKGGVVVGNRPPTITEAGIGHAAVIQNGRPHLKRQAGRGERSHVILDRAPVLARPGRVVAGPEVGPGLSEIWPLGRSRHPDEAVQPLCCGRLRPAEGGD